MSETTTVPAGPLVLDLHRGGKLAVRSRVDLSDQAVLSQAYTPGVADVSLLLHDRPELVYEYTWKSSSVAVVTDGTAVLGLGDIGPVAALPVMEGKCALFAHFAGLNAVPICLDTTDADQIVETVTRIAPAFGAINLEDISAPRCFDIEKRVDSAIDIPVFHDDQHGTAIVVTAALMSAARLLERDLRDLRVVIQGAGAAGVAIVDALLDLHVRDITVLDRHGVLAPERDDIDGEKRRLATITNGRRMRGTLEDALVGADVFVGVSGGRVPHAWIDHMRKPAVVLALANPHPEVDPDAVSSIAAIVGTGRSDRPNQVNNVLAFPGVIAGALAARATTITPQMRRAAAIAIADVAQHGLAPDHIVPPVSDSRVSPAVAAAVAEAWTGSSTISSLATVDPLTGGTHEYRG